MRRFFSHSQILKMTSSSAASVTPAADFHHHSKKGKVDAPRTTNGPLFDSHCHIGLGFSYGPDGEDPTPASPHWPFKHQQGQFECEDQFIRAIDTGVKKMTLIGIDAASSDRVRLISTHLNKIMAKPAAAEEINGAKAADATTPPQLSAYWTAGIHPHSAHLHETEFPILDDLIRTAMTSKPSTSRLVAIGETGMDFFKSRGSFEQQRDSLVKHLQIAKEFDLPVIIHAREADNELYDVLKQFAPVAGVMHCFSSDAAWMDKYLALGFYISFTNNITYAKSVGIQDACAKCPLDRIVIETDSPFLPPQRIRGQSNEPANTRDTFEQACKLRRIWGDEGKMSEFQQALWRNTHALFRLPME